MKQINVKMVIKIYNDLKIHNETPYLGMKVGGSHCWNYDNGIWHEIKKAPDRWDLKFNCVKTRGYSAPINTGAKIGTVFHWFIIANQLATKLNNNSYMTSMQGIKFKIGHKRPHWKTFSYNYSNQVGYKEKLITILEDVLNRLKNGNSYLESY